MQVWESDYVCRERGYSTDVWIDDVPCRAEVGAPAETQRNNRHLVLLLSLALTTGMVFANLVGYSQIIYFPVILGSWALHSRLSFAEILFCCNILTKNVCCPLNPRSER